MYSAGGKDDKIIKVVYTKSMVVKKKPQQEHTVVEQASDSLEESVVQEERRSAVTQVVEIIEDDAPIDSSEKNEVVEKDLLEQKTSVESQHKSTQGEDLKAEEKALYEKEQDMEDDIQDEKRKILVDELFQKKQSNPVEVMPEISAHRSHKKNPIVFWAIGIVSACVVIGVSLVLFSGKKAGMPSIVLIPTATPTKSPTVTATPTPVVIKKESITIQVLNGGGKVGAATKMKKALEEKGYTVKDTGNTEEYTYESTEIHVKSSKKEYVAVLEQDLKTSYTIGTSASDLEDSVAYDVRIIVGKQ